MFFLHVFGGDASLLEQTSEDALFLQVLVGNGWQRTSFVGPLETTLGHRPKLLQVQASRYPASALSRL